MSKDIWHDCKKQPPLVDDGELVLMDSNGKFWVGFCEITSDGVSYFANNAEPLKNDFVKYARIDKLIASEPELDRTRKALDIALDKLKRIQKIYTNAPFNAPINYANVCTDMYDVAIEQIKELDNE